MGSVAKTIKTIRRNLYLEVSEFARLIGVTPQSVYYYEKGQKMPKLKVIKKLLDLAKKNGMDYSLETTIDNINQTLIRLENKMDQGFKEVNVKIDKINDRLWSNFLWLLSAMFLFSGILCSVMAKGFDWFS